MDNAGEVVLPIDGDDDKPFRSKQYLTEKLDCAEMLVENIRKEALKMAEDLDNVYNSVDAVRNSKLLISLSDVDKDDIGQFADRIVSRCDTVHINVLTTRNDSQQNCLEEINTLIDKIVSMLRDDPDGAKSTCQSYLASCSSSETETGSKVFEAAVLGCTLDDQKRIHKRLQGLLDYIVHTTYAIESDNE